MSKNKNLVKRKTLREKRVDEIFKKRSLGVLGFQHDENIRGAIKDALDICEPVRLPIPGTIITRLKRYADQYEMVISQDPGDPNYWLITPKHPEDLYWLGANLSMPAFKNGVTEHY